MGSPWPLFLRILFLSLSLLGLPRNEIVNDVPQVPLVLLIFFFILLHRWDNFSCLIFKFANLYSAYSSLLLTLPLVNFILATILLSTRISISNFFSFFFFLFYSLPFILTGAMARGLMTSLAVQRELGDGRK